MKKKDLIRIVVTMREAQKDYEEHRTRANEEKKIEAETWVDEWLLEYTAEQIQLDMWTRGEPIPGLDSYSVVKTDEEAGAYNVPHDGETEEESSA